MTSSSDRGEESASSRSAAASSSSSSSSSSSAASEEENRKLNFDLEILCWRVSRFVEKLNAQLHFDWIVLGHAESVSIRRKGPETFDVDEEEEEEEGEEEAEDDTGESHLPLKLHCVDETSPPSSSVDNNIPKKRMKMSPDSRREDRARGSSSLSTSSSSSSALSKNAATGEVAPTNAVSSSTAATTSDPHAVDSSSSPSSSSSSSEDKSNDHPTGVKTNSIEKPRASPRIKGASPKANKHKSINYGKSSSSVTVVAKSSLVATNTVIDLTDLSTSSETIMTSTTTPTPTLTAATTTAATTIPAAVNSNASHAVNNSSGASAVAPPAPSSEPPRRKPFQCSFCPFSTERSLNLQNHQLTHADFLPQNKGSSSGGVNSVGSGAVSTNAVDDAKESETEDVKIEGSSGVLSCTECTYTTAQLSQLNRHMLLHSDVRPYTCDKCDFACNTSLNLDIHMQTHGGGDQPKASELEQILDSSLGSACAKQTFSVSDFDLSFLTGPNAVSNGVPPPPHTTAPTSTPNGCNNGGGGGSSSTSISSTISASSTTTSSSASSSSSSSTGSPEEHPYRCGRCSYSSKNLNDLKQHFGSHVGEALKAPLKCTKCNFSCHESSQLKEHFQAIHAKKQNHDVC